jgi:hypothetical protein
MFEVPLRHAAAAKGLLKNCTTCRKTFEIRPARAVESYPYGPVAALIRRGKDVSVALSRETQHV